MKRFLLFIPFITFLTIVRLSAQFDAQYSQHMLAPAIYNPAMVGMDDALMINLFNRQQWVSIPNAPTSFLLQAGIPKQWGKYVHGFGLLISNENIGLFQNQQLQLQYAWHQSLWGGHLSTGLQAGVLQQNFDASGIYIPNSDYHNPSDQSIPSGSLEGIIPDFQLGVQYLYDNLQLGLAATHLLESSIKLKPSAEATDEESYRTFASRTYYLNGSYNIKLRNPFYTLQPTILLKSDFTALQTDLSTVLRYKESFWGIAGWRPGDALIFGVGMQLKQGLRVGYAYDVPIGVMGLSTGGSHEIFLGFRRKISTSSTSKKQKSVRIL